MAEIVAVPGRVLGSDIGDQAATVADAAARLAQLLAGFAGPLDVPAVLGCLGRADVSLRAATTELSRRTAGRPPGGPDGRSG